MKKFLFLIIMLALLPSALAAYCDSFNEQQCINNAKSWFETESCNSQIRCSPKYDSYNEFGLGAGFLSCETQYKQNFSDCENNPTSFCYNDIAYSTAESRKCTCGNGFQYRVMDSCGNPGEWSDTCLEIQSCQLKTITHYSGFTVDVHESCRTTQCDGYIAVTNDAASDIDAAETIENLPFDVDISKAKQQYEEKERTITATSPVPQESQQAINATTQQSSTAPKQQMKVLGKSDDTDISSLIVIIVLIIFIIATSTAIYYTIVKLLLNAPKKRRR